MRGEKETQKARCCLLSEYQSRCLDCGAVFDEALRIGVAGGKTRFLCPECKGTELRLILPDPFASATWKITVKVEQVDDEEGRE